MGALGADPGVLLRTALVGVLAYLALVAMVRMSGKRTLSQMNAFDFIVTVALGSTLATILLSDDVSLMQGLVAFGVLIGMQLLITWTSLRWHLVARLAKSEPTIVVLRGQLVDRAMRRERLLAAEVQAALREHGLARVEDADLVILETDGTISVVPSLPGSAWDAPEVRTLLRDDAASLGGDRSTPRQ